MDLTASSHLALLSGWGSFASLFHVRTVLLELQSSLNYNNICQCCTQYLSFLLQSLHKEVSFDIFFLLMMDQSARSGVFRPQL